VSFDVDEHVVGFEVSVDVLHFVDGVEGEENLGGVELGFFVGEDVLLHEEVHEVAAWEELHDEVEVIVVLEGAFEVDHPGVFLADGEDVPFLPALHDFVFVDHLRLL